MRSSSTAWGIGGMRAGKGVASVRLLLGWDVGIWSLWFVDFLAWFESLRGGGTGFVVLWVWCWCC